MISPRIQKLYSKHQERVNLLKPSHFFKDYHYSGLNEFADLPQWEKTARAMAYAIASQDVTVYADDGIGGRVNHNREEEVIQACPSFDFKKNARAKFKKICPQVDELLENQLIFGRPSGVRRPRSD